MAEIHAEYRRVFQVKPYETETIVLSVTDTVELLGDNTDDRSKETAGLASAYFKQLAEIGDQVMKERLEARKAPF